MSEWSILPGDSSEGGSVSSESDSFVFESPTPMPRATRRNKHNANANATWFGSQAAADTHFEGDAPGRDPSPNLHNINETKPNIASQGQTIPKSTSQVDQVTANSVTRDKASAPAPRFIDGIEVSTLRHFVLTVTDQQQNMPSKIWATIEHDYERHGISSMLHTVLWANIYLLEDRENGFWKEVKRVATAKVPKDLSCEILVKGDTEKVRRVFRSINLLVHNGKHFFNGDNFYFSFRNGLFLWQFYGDGPDLHNFLLEQGIPTVEKAFDRISSAVPNPWYP
jgi:hypothetical protein